MFHPTRIAAGVIVMFLVAACASPAGQPSIGPAASSPGGSDDPTADSMTQRSEGGEVTVDATWSGPAAGAAFQLKLDTHSVDLDPLDLSDAALRNDRGASLSAQRWVLRRAGTTAKAS